MNNEDRIIQEIVEMKGYIRENLITRDEFNERMDEQTSQIQGFVKLHEKLDHEHAALCSRVGRLEDRVVSVESRTAGV